MPIIWYSPGYTPGDYLGDISLCSVISEGRVAYTYCCWLLNKNIDFHEDYSVPTPMSQSYEQLENDSLFSSWPFYNNYPMGNGLWSNELHIMKEYGFLESCILVQNSVYADIKKD